MIDDNKSEFLPDLTPLENVRKRERCIPLAFQVIGIALLIGSAIFANARWKTGSMSLVKPYLQGQRLLIEPTRIALGEVPRGEVVEYELRVSNVASTELKLTGAQKSCSCIAIGEFPIRVAPGETTCLRVSIALGC